LALEFRGQQFFHRAEERVEVYVQNSSGHLEPAEVYNPQRW
jgi:hypothetical protein